MRNQATLAAGQAQQPRRALRLARYFLGDEYDEEVLPAEVICTLYISIPLGIAVVAILMGLLLYFAGNLALEKIYGG